MTVMGSMLLAAFLYFYFYLFSVTVDTYETKNGKRNYSKTDFCLFCNGSYNSKMSKHLLSVHLKEEKVQNVTALPLGSKERKAALQKLQNEGNFNHNVKVIKNGKGKLVVYRRPKNSSISACDYLPCEYCLAFVHEKMMWLHAKSCYYRPGSVDTDNNYVRNGRIMLAPFMQVRPEHEIEALDMVIMKMKETTQNPGLKNICCDDQLIREFGNSLLDKLGTEEEQRRKDQDNIRTKMRSVARLLQKLNENKLRSLPLSDFISGREFMNVVTAVKELSLEANSPNLALTLGHYVKQICLLKVSSGIMTEDMRKKEDANNFKELYAAHWNSKVSCVASRRMRLRCLNKKEEIPQTEDLVKLKEYLETGIKRGIKISNPNYEQYVEFAQTVLARIVIFNKRRIAEVAELKVKDFENRVKGGDTGQSSEIVNSLGFSERTLLKR